MQDVNYPPLKKISGWKLNVIVIVLYIILTIILTFPVAFTIGSKIPGVGDAFYWMNSLWYTNFALAHADITSLTYNNIIFYPTGVPVMPFPSAFNQILTILLLHFFKIQIIYSLLWLLSFILAAFGAYLLVKYLTQNDYAAFLSGIIFAFTPYHFVHGLGHLGATTIQWLPFCALFFMKVYREGGIKNCILAGIFYIFVALSDMQYLVFMGLFIGILFLYEHGMSIQLNRGFRIEVHKSILIKYLIIGIVAFSIILPLTISDIQVALSGINFLKPNPLDAIKYSTDILSFFLPSTLHPIFGETVSPIYQKFTGNVSENTTYIGYTVLVLSIFALFALWKDLTVRFWGIIAIIFSIFSLGPVLHVAGQTVFTVFHISIPLPHLILYYFIPFMENSRTTGRFFIVAVLAFAVLAGFGCNELLKRHDTKKTLIVTLIATLIVFEYLCIPFPVSVVNQPDFYQKIGLDPDQYALLEIPIASNYEAGVRIIYYQTIHGKPVVSGQIGRAPVNVRDFEKNTPFINEISYQRSFDDILIQEKYNTTISVLNYYNIRYIIIHKDFLNPDKLQIAREMVDNLNESVYMDLEDDKFILYQISTSPYQRFMVIADGWNTVEPWYGGPGRWMKKDAKLRLISPVESKSILSFEVGSLHQIRELKVLFNNETIGIYNVSINKSNDTTPDTIEVPVHILKGENTIEFYTPQNATIPSEIGAWNDARELSLAFQNIQIFDTSQKSIKMSDGWYAPEQWSDGPGRWMQKDAKLQIFSPNDSETTLSFEVGSLNQTRELVIILNNQTIGQYHVSRKTWSDNTPDTIQLPLHLSEGKNVIEFYTPQNGTIPSEIGAWNDTRELNLAFQNISLFDTKYPS